MSTWNQLFHLNENENTKKKGKFTYLSWTHAWTALMKTGLDVGYTVGDVEYHKDETATVHTEMTIDGVTFPMWLPVMDHRNNSVSNPHANDINKARMRCLVKNIAMFGLGIYIYAGEDLPEAPAFDYATIQASVDAVIKGIAEGNLSAARKAWQEMTQDEKNQAWVAKSKGGSFNTAEKKVLQSTEFREA